MLTLDQNFTSFSMISKLCNKSLWQLEESVLYVHVNIIPGRNCRPRTQTWRPSLPDWPSEAGLHDGEEAEGGASASARKRNCKSWGRNNRIMQESKILFSYILC